MMKRFAQSILVLALLAVPTFASAGEKEARAFVQKLSNDVLAVLKNDSLETNAKQAKLITVFNNTVDTKWIGRFVLGRYYNQANAGQKKRYDDLYKDFLIRSYVPRFKDYKGQDVELKEVRADGKGEYVVQTNIVSPSGEPPLRMDYRIRETGGTFKVVDIISEGVSMINTQRSEFGSVVSREGMDYLLEQLASRVENMKAAN